MRNEIPKNPFRLAVFIANILAGDDKHQQDKPLPKDLRAELETTHTQLVALNGSVQFSKGQYRQDSQKRREYIPSVMGLAERARDAVIGIVGQRNEVLVDYVLAARRKSHKAGTAEAGIQSATTKAEKKRLNALLRVSKVQAQLEKVQGRLAKAQAVLGRREAEAALAAQAPSPEPNPASQPSSSSDPTPSTGTK